MVYAAFVLTIVFPAQPALRFRCYANLLQKPYFMLMFDQVCPRRHMLRTRFFALFDEVLVSHCNGETKALLADATATGQFDGQFKGFAHRIVLFMRWFQCLFIAVLPFRAAFRVWDAFLLHGCRALSLRYPNVAHPLVQGPATEPHSGVGYVMR